jgi:hypothetical protein
MPQIEMLPILRVLRQGLKQPADSFPRSELRFAAYEAMKPRASGGALDMQRLAKALQKEGLIERIKRGEYRLTEQGLAATSF